MQLTYDPRHDIAYFRLQEKNAEVETIHVSDACRAAEGSAPAGRRPALVIQHDRFNRSAISTTVVAAITSNLRLGAMPGNVRLRGGEAGLPHASVVNVSQIRTIDRTRLVDRAGVLGAQRRSRAKRSKTRCMWPWPLLTEWTIS